MATFLSSHAPITPFPPHPPPCPRISSRLPRPLPAQKLLPHLSFPTIPYLFHRNALKLRLCARNSTDPRQASSPLDTDPSPPPYIQTSELDWRWRRTAPELVAYALLFAAIPIGSLLPRIQFSGSFYFMFLALWSVYVGSHRSLERYPPQKMSFEQGLAVPILCSLSLLGFYCLLRFFPELDLKTFFSIYLAFAGSIAVASNLTGPVGYILPATKSFSQRINIPQWLLQDNGQPVHFTLSAADCISLLVGIGAVITSKQIEAPFTVNNFVAVCIVTELLNLLSLGSFFTAAATLLGLLLYDVFWVFGSPFVFGDNVMVAVATSNAFDGPMKLVFPNWHENAANMYSILGLGDIAAPGLLIALMLRFDQSRAKDIQATSDNKLDKTYFVTCLASYVVGLAATIVINSITGAAQPALLYLVPSLLIGVFTTALFRSEKSLLLDFRDEI